MKCILVPTLLGILLSGCTVYRSDGRKQFETAAPGKVAAASFQLLSCKKENKLESWLNEEFPNHSYELIVADSDLEIWRTNRNNKIEVKAIQRSEKSTHSCIYEFADEAVWNQYKEQFIRELENNIMTAE
ncbi:hypothetical protein [Bdellovibrio reynosensis]|uniref:Lipoprotein n=1 Tax=Bdellovibrio reynosensis TaxID=2835041 RepID=A0ABY4CFA0_9BACT|nr:hypothetical protein [Bdellovibrio reynosensis]UOF02341.1 hypothetical protein MNR06_05170 [Bdellovibrio reynosensis]